jgi:hypothetical protein
MNDYSKNLIKAKDIIGGYEAVGRVCGGLTGKAVKKWADAGKPPRTEYSGETKYARLIARATKNAVKASQLLPKIK